MVNAQTVVFEETFGEQGPTANPRARIGAYTDYDNGVPVVFSESNPDSYADIRATASMDTHVWFPANKETDLIISNINTNGYSNLKLSFDIACNSKDGNTDKLTLYCNDVAVTVSSVAVGAQNTYVSSGEIALSNAATTKLRFLYTAANNPTNYGYRLDNVKITGLGGSGLNNPANESPVFHISGNELIVKNIAEGTIVEFYNAVGAKVQTSTYNGNSIQLDNLSKGVYIVRAGKYVQKIMF